jgi:hypothetical protein
VEKQFAVVLWYEFKERSQPTISNLSEKYISRLLSSSVQG